ncbi:MAG: spore germination protein [Firmicutes bacterium]|nr:spore germination protein [Bacillota bacterium]
MLKKILKLFGRPSSPSKKGSAQTGNQGHNTVLTPISPDLQGNVLEMRHRIGQSGDIVFRTILVQIDRPRQVLLVYTEGLVDKTLLSTGVLKPLLLGAQTLRQRGGIGRKDPLEKIRDLLVAVGEVTEAATIDEVLNNIFFGMIALFMEGMDKALLLNLVLWEDRAVDEPETETVVRGPREGFIETLRVNTSLVRRKIRSPHLRIEFLRLGRITHTDVAVAYIDGIANPEILAEVRRRLERIDIDGILETGYIEEFIEDEPYSVFPQIFHTERPDVVAAGLLEGRIAILVDGTPFALLIPAVFAQFLQSPEDYYERPHIAVWLRLVRYGAFFITLTAPSLYIALTTFHPEMLPTALAMSVAAGREGVPFPAFMEALLMEATFELLREAGLRLPKPFGQVVGIVGAIVIGEAVVRAGIVSPAMVIIVAIAAIASFAIPVFSMAIPPRLLKFPMMFLAASLGLFGVMVGLIAITVHLASIRSFGVPYLSPIAPRGSMKDVVLRTFWWAMIRRPPLIGKYNPTRQRHPVRPHPPREIQPQEKPFQGTRGDRQNER